MILGARGETPDDLRELFQRTGTMHLFAVSGFNVAMLAVFAWFVLKPLRLSRRAAVLVIIPLLGALCAGHRPERELRAGGRHRLEHPARRDACAIAGRPRSIRSRRRRSLILAWDTNQLFSTGLPVLLRAWCSCLILGAQPVQRWLQPLGQPGPFSAGSALELAAARAACGWGASPRRR